jgi:hypothetical protein
LRCINVAENCVVLLTALQRSEANEDLRPCPNGTLGFDAFRLSPVGPWTAAHAGNEEQLVDVAGCETAQTKGAARSGSPDGRVGQASDDRGA